MDYRIVDAWRNHGTNCFTLPNRKFVINGTNLSFKGEKILKMHFFQASSCKEEVIITIGLIAIAIVPEKSKIVPRLI
jgi:hypothetical protein